MDDAGLRLVYVVSKWNQETETFVRREVAAALADGTRIQVVSLRSPGLPDGILGDHAVDVIVPTVRDLVRGTLAMDWRALLAAFVVLLRILRFGRPRTWLHHLRAWGAGITVAWRLEPADLVLAHFAWVSSTTADTIHWVRDLPFGIFVHAHGIYETRCQDRYLTDRLRRAGVVLVESEHIADDVERLHGIEPIVMRMGVPAEFLVARPTEPRQVEPPLLVSVGALREKKGYDLLIRAVALLENVELRIAGDGPQRAELEALIADLEVEDRVELLGHQDQDAVLALLDQASLFCLASRLTASGDRDGVPNVLIEAMARGVPVVATEVSGIPNLLMDGCGVLVEPDDLEALALGIESLLEDEDRSLRMAQHGYDRIRSHYTAEGNWARLRSEIVTAVRNTEAATRR